MCGISGILAFNQVGAFYMINLAKSLDCLAQRGPDARGTYIEDLYAVGHRRLSIIDTDSRSNQPMKDESGRYVISFNGEIFNYRDIKASLEKEGIHFQTNSDTEVLLKSYIHKGERAFNEFVGFFAFAIFDTQEKELVICRDRYGIKPLVYYLDEDKFLFASEMKSIMSYNISKAMDLTSIQQFFQFNYVPPQHSIYEEVQKLTPGTFIRVKGKQVSKHTYYTLPPAAATRSVPSYESAVTRFKTLMEQAVVDRLVADVPLGSFLSGGLDSSIITGIASQHFDNLHTFSIGYDGLSAVFDESPYALAAAKHFNTKHHVFQLSAKDFEENVFAALDYMDEPFADSAMLPMYILSKKASAYLKVALSGDGADELLGGYNKHHAEWKVRTGDYPHTLFKAFRLFAPFLKAGRNSAWGNFIRRVKKFDAMKNLSAEDRYYSMCLVSQPDTLLKVFQPSFTGETQDWHNRKKEVTGQIKETQSDMNDVFRSDIFTVLQGDMLYKTDMMSMANSLEVRVPFLDHRVVDFVTTLPSTYKIDQQRRKKIARDAFGDLLPEAILQRKKKGFDVPVEEYIYKNGDIRHFLSESITEEFLKEQNLFDVSFAKAMVPVKGKAPAVDTHLWWAYLVFQYWYKKNNISTRSQA